MNYLIVGLGNVGFKYENTRHNIGFEVVDALAKRFEAEWELGRHAHVASFRFKSRQFTMLKPTTFMNLSGKAVKFWMDKLKIKQENILVIVDDLAIPFGKLRLKTKGSAGGHNGLKDIELQLQSNQYSRLRFGISDDFGKGKQINYVLGEWSEMEKAELPDYIKKASEMTLAFATIGAARTMSEFNR